MIYKLAQKVPLISTLWTICWAWKQNDLVVWFALYNSGLYWVVVEDYRDFWWKYYPNLSENTDLGTLKLAGKLGQYVSYVLRSWFKNKTCSKKVLVFILRYVEIAKKQFQLTFFQSFICLLTLTKRNYILYNVLNIFWKFDLEIFYSSRATTISIHPCAFHRTCLFVVCMTQIAISHETD